MQLIDGGSSAQWSVRERTIGSFVGGGGKKLAELAHAGGRVCCRCALVEARE